MTYLDALKERVGAKAAARIAYRQCPGDHFDGASSPCRDSVRVSCGRCWMREMPPREAARKEEG